MTWQATKINQVSETSTSKEFLYIFFVRKIPDNTGVQEVALSTHQNNKQNKKGQQFPLIGETAAESRAFKTGIKNNFFDSDRFCTPSAGRTPDRQPATQPLPAEWGNCQKGNPEKAISPNPNRGGTAAQIWNLPNLEGVDKQSSITNNASTAKAGLKCITVPEDAPIPCHAKDNNSLLAKPLPFHSQKGIPDNTKCLGSPVQCFVLFMPH
ncbi:hypothetical protein DSO57_1034884 [Entomophthora muscae]|uniref:Uncharacterized protein n=1 Tax=Entomophthora muscae TaxID=34485 RepID=A0ACC2RQP5_9FUNG|nr:hypothetical protein DSO57_1034884 [Entomophthora muscae]